MKLLEINTVNFGSTGNIMRQIAEVVRKQGDQACLCYPKYDMNRRNKADGDILIGNKLSFFVHSKITSFTGFNGCGSVLSTIHFLKVVDRLNIDCIHLHNLHNSYINLPILFHYLKRKNIAVVWTLHDCWSFTGQCPHFTMTKCDKWQTGCYDCSQIHAYPASHVDQTRLMWKLKKKWFNSVKNLTIVTPSNWLAGLVKQSFLKEYTVKVIHNGIDLNTFQPITFAFRTQQSIPEKKPILLGVAFGWGKRKGLDVFLELNKRFGDATQIVLVGTDDKIDAQLPPNIISIHRTQNQQELAEIYSAADVFVNPTREEVLGLVNIEALACGTPVITFETGGSPECIDETCGMVVPCDDVDALERAIRYVIAEKPFSAEACRQRAEQFDMRDKFAEYVALYEKLCNV